MFNNTHWRRLSGSLAFLAIFLLSVGCSSDEYSFGSGGEEVDVCFSAIVDQDARSRAIGDAEGLDRLTVVAVPVGGGKAVRREMDWSVAESDGVDLRLVRGIPYRILFWADKDRSLYTIGDDASVTLNINLLSRASADGGFAMMEKLDAFSEYREYTAKANSVTTVTLRRPVGQLTLGAEVKPEPGTHSATISIDNFPASFSFARGEVTATEGMSLTYTDFPDEPIAGPDGKNYYPVATCFLFPGTYSVSYALEANGNQLIARDFAGTPVRANYLTNILGDIVEEPVESDVWDGITISQPQVENSEYVITNCAELAWLADNNLNPPLPISVVSDLDMSNGTLKSLNIPEGGVLKGNGRTIAGLNLSDGGLLGDVADVSISDINLVIDTFEPHNAHAGALINTLRGSADVEGVKISGRAAARSENLSVSALNGAAGGFIGYAAGNADNAPSSITFKNCSISWATVSGDLDEGIYIGLSRGYDNNQSITFAADCRADNVTVSDHESLYREGNEGAWLSATDYSRFDGWLGGEEYHRGVVTLGSDRFIPKWDGSSTAVPLKNGNTHLIYSPFDLAYLQGKAAGSIEMMENVDLGGYVAPDYTGLDAAGLEFTFVPTDHRNRFRPISSLSTLKGNDKTVYNLYVENFPADGSFFAGFVRSITSPDVSDFTLDNAVVIGHKFNETTQEHSYAGALTASVGGSGSIKNVKIRNSRVKGLGKVGGMIGQMGDSGTNPVTIDDCRVDNTTVANFQGAIEEIFMDNALARFAFYAHGECGGFIGFIASFVKITNCHVDNIVMDCFNEKDQLKDMIVTKVRVPGRHVNRFIGDFRSIYSYHHLWLAGCSAANVTNLKGNEARVYNRVKTGGSSLRPTYTNEYFDLIGAAYYVYYMGVAGNDEKGGVHVDGVEIPYIKSADNKDYNDTDYKKI